MNRAERGRDVRPPATSLLTPTIAASEVRTPIPFMRPVELCAVDHPIFHTIHFRTIPLPEISQTQILSVFPHWQECPFWGGTRADYSRLVTPRTPSPGRRVAGDTTVSPSSGRPKLDANRPPTMPTFFVT